MVTMPWFAAVKNHLGLEGPLAVAFAPLEQATGASNRSRRLPSFVPFRVAQDIFSSKFKEWQASSLCDCAKHCLQGGTESIPSFFWTYAKKFFCKDCGKIVSTTHRTNHDKKCKPLVIPALIGVEQPGEGLGVPPGQEQSPQMGNQLDEKHLESPFPSLNEVVEKSSRVLKRVPRGARASFARALVQLSRSKHSSRKADSL